MKNKPLKVQKTCHLPGCYGCPQRTELYAGLEFGAAHCLPIHSRCENAATHALRRQTWHIVFVSASIYFCRYIFSLKSLFSIYSVESNSKLSVGKNLRRDEKQDRQAAKNCLPSNCFFSPKIKTVKIGEMLHSKIVRLIFFSAELKNQAVKPRENVCRAFCFFLLNTNLSNEEKSSE